MSSRSFLFSAIQTFVECYAKFEGGKVADVVQIISHWESYTYSAFKCKMFSLLSFTLSQITEQVFKVYGVKQYNLGLYLMFIGPCIIVITEE